MMRAGARRGMGSVSRGDREWTLGTGGREGWDRCLGDIEWTVGPGEGRGQCLTGTEVPFGMVESSGVGWWGRLHIMHLLSALSHALS